MIRAECKKPVYFLTHVKNVDSFILKIISLFHIN